ncbi:DUF4440 domain-containing protein [Streptomyces sp. NPDC005077]|uniref:DUF4440 domain-containing protein n=1 Tax=Streptomyces sp. NPDC005077 TaxID=3154292 RepID=UPI0033BB58EF
MPQPTAPLTEFIRTYEQATNSHDITQLVPLIAPDAVYWFSDGSHRGREAILSAIAKTFATIRDEIYQIDDLEWIAHSDDHAVCRYRFTWTGTIDSQRQTARSERSAAGGLSPVRLLLSSRSVSNRIATPRSGTVIAPLQHPGTGPTAPVERPGASCCYLAPGVGRRPRGGPSNQAVRLPRGRVTPTYGPDPRSVTRAIALPAIPNSGARSGYVPWRPRAHNGSEAPGTPPRTAPPWPSSSRAWPVPSPYRRAPTADRRRARPPAAPTVRLGGPPIGNPQPWRQQGQR